MHISAKYEDGKPAAYTAVYDAVKGMAEGEELRVDGMDVEGRTVGTKIFQSLVHAVEYDLGYVFSTNIRYEYRHNESGWSKTETKSYYIIITRVL